MNVNENARCNRECHGPCLDFHVRILIRVQVPLEKGSLEFPSERYRRRPTAQPGWSPRRRFPREPGREQPGTRGRSRRGSGLRGSEHQPRVHRQFVLYQRLETWLRLPARGPSQHRCGGVDQNLRRALNGNEHAAIDLRICSWGPAWVE
jgi:hypothetical protein